MKNMNLLSVQGQGALFLVLLFVLCAVVVYGTKLAKIGYRSTRKKDETPPPPEKKPEPKPKPKPEPPEPVYFIVEKKKKRAKAEYSAPKEITFRDSKPH